MSTAALLGLESSKSYQSLKQIQGTMRELFDIRASDQRSEESFAKQEAVAAKRANQDAKRYEARQIKSAADYERAVKSGGGGGAAAGAGLVAAGLLGAALLGKTQGLKNIGNRIFDKGSEFAKTFTENFNQELDKKEKTGSTTPSSSTPSSSTPTPTPTPTPSSRIVTRQYKGKKDKNYQAYAKIYNSAAKIKAPYPELVAARAMLESGWLGSDLAKRGKNPFGQTGSGDAGTLNYKGRTWAKYSSFDAAVKAHVKRWASKTPQGKPGYGTYDSPMAGLVGTLENYAPSSDGNNHQHYTNSVTSIMKKYGFDPNKQNPITKMQKGGVLEHAMGNGPEGENRLALNTALNPQIMDGKKPTMNLPGFQRGGKIFLHWAASGYNANFPQNYHTVFKGDGTAQRNQSYSKFRTRKGHTWRRNGQGIGLSMASMGGKDPWSTPTTDAQVNSMADEIAKVAKDWGWKAEDINKTNVMTHAEVAKIDGYFGERWDLWHIKKNDPKGSGGDRIRALARAKFTGSASTSYQGPGRNEEEELAVRSGEDRGERMVHEKDQDNRRPLSERNQPTKDVLGEQFKRFGPFGQVALEIARKINQRAGFELIPGIGTGATKGSDNIEAVEKDVTALTGNQQQQPQTQPQASTVKKEEKKEPTKAEAAKNVQALKNSDTVLKKVKAASHPDTGSGYTLQGLNDYKGRPAVFSRAAAYHFGKMMSDSQGKIKGTHISSSQRSQKKNSSLPGAHPNSSHLYGEALDIIDGSMEYMKLHGKKYGWEFGYSHGPGSAHFNYKGPTKLKVQGRQGGGVVQMKQSGGIASQFNNQHTGSYIKNKYGRRTIIIQRAPNQIPPASGGNGNGENPHVNSGPKPTNIDTAQHMYKIQMGAFV